MTIEKIKILGIVLELPAKQHCQFGTFLPNFEVPSISSEIHVLLYKPDQREVNSQYSNAIYANEAISKAQRVTGRMSMACIYKQSILRICSTNAVFYLKNEWHFSGLALSIIKVPVSLILSNTERPLKALYRIQKLVLPTN